MSKRPVPKRQYSRMLRVNELLREVIAEAVRNIDDERLVDVAVTNVVCESDLGSATVYYDALDGDDVDDEVKAAFEEMRGRLQTTINRETKLKGTPKLTFVADPVVRSAERIDWVLRGLNEHDFDDAQIQTESAGDDKASN